jgi:hypothetical protein
MPIQGNFYRDFGNLNPVRPASFRGDGRLQCTTNEPVENEAQTYTCKDSLPPTKNSRFIFNYRDGKNKYQRVDAMVSRDARFTRETGLENRNVVIRDFQNIGGTRKVVYLFNEIGDTNKIDSTVYVKDAQGELVPLAGYNYDDKKGVVKTESTEEE